MRLFGFGQSHHQRIDSYFRGPLDGQRRPEVHQARFGCAIGGGARGGANGADTGDVDDAATFRLLLHHPIDHLAEIQWRYQVEPNDGFRESR